MKTLRYLFFCGVIVAGMIVVSCKNYLDAPPQGSLSSPVLQNNKGVKALLVGAYGALDASGQYNANDITGSYSPWEVSPDNWIYGDVAGGTFHKGSDPGDQGTAINPIARMTVNPQNGFLDAKWRADFEGVSRSNQVITTANQTSDLSSQQKNEMIGEARFLRGYYYFDLKKMFDKVPWISDSTTNYQQPNNKDIWPNIEADFKFAMDNLPGTQSDIGQANKWAAAAFLAKSYMFEKKFQEADALYDEIRQNGTNSLGVKYQLTPNFEDNFRSTTQNNSEQVFEIQQVANDGTSTIANARMGDMLNFPYNSPFGCCGFYQPTLDLVNSYRTDGNGLPYISESNKFAYDDTMVTNDQNVAPDAQFTPYQGHLDPRLDWTVGRRGIPYLDWGPFPGTKWVRNTANGGPYVAKKIIYWRSLESVEADHSTWAPGTAINVVVIRYADVLLMAAEAKAQLGNLDEARQLVNQVRDRMINNPQNWVNYKYNEAYALKTVDSQAAMLALDAIAGDYVVRTDTKSTWVLLKGDPSNINNWNEYKDPNYKIGEYPPGSFTSKQDALTKIYFERKLELAGEGHTFFDLVRTGQANEQLNHYFQYEGQYVSDIKGAKFTDTYQYYPIPQNQIDIMGKDANGKPILTQNPGY
ncbi:MAG TPA: RagB/SusD family nutrient uptake outer membrane protein [Balneolales bacterium]|nr:RagB/SusD family nutrient uptake outer membrane protein [Balneolales bacterium]